MLGSEHHPDRCISDIAIMAAGCVTVPTYTTNTERDHTHIIENSGAAAVLVSHAKLARTVLPAVIRSSHARIVIGMEDLSAAQSGASTPYSLHHLFHPHPPDPENPPPPTPFPP